MGSSKNLYQSRYLKWWVIQPLMPNKPRDLPRVEDRRVLSGIFWVPHRAPRPALGPILGPTPTTPIASWLGARRACSIGLCAR